MNRRELMMACAAIAGSTVLTSSAVSMPLLPPLKPLPPDLVGFAEAGLRQWLSGADDPAWPVEQRLHLQQVCARRMFWLAWPEPEALRRFSDIADRWPVVRPVAAKVAEARIDELEIWDEAGYWDFTTVRR